MKKYLLTAALLLLVGITASAYSFKAGRLCYNITGTNTVAVTFENNTDASSIYPAYETLSGNITIPETVYNGGNAYTVTAITDFAFFKCTLLTGITIPKTVKTIGQYVFACGTTPSTISSLSRVIFAEDSELTSIGNYAFATTRITEVAIPNTVTTIGDDAFRYTLLEKFNIPPRIQTMGEGVLSICTCLTNVSIPTVLTELPKRTFQGCGSLTNIGLPATMTAIGDYAFFGAGLTSINLPSSLTTIGAYSFRSTKLTSITIPSSVTTIGEHAFENTQLTTVTIPSSVTSIGGRTFSGVATMKTAKIQNSIISNEEFEYCTNLEEVTIESGVESIGNYSFYECPSLKTLKINSALATDINQYFGDIKPTLKTVKIDNAVTAIPENAFLDCAALETITIPSTIASIGNSAFSGCSALREFYSLMERPISIDESVFNGVQQHGYCDLHVPEGSKFRYEAMEVWKEFASITEDAGHPSQTGIRGDVNGDGVVSATDISIIVNILAGLEQ